MTTTKAEAWTLLRQESQLYITEDNKVADGSMDLLNIKLILSSGDVMKNRRHLPTYALSPLTSR
jgi:hypothetical protein